MRQDGCTPGVSTRQIARPITSHQLRNSVKLASHKVRAVEIRPVFRDPSEENRVWALFDWDEKGWRSFVSDPEVRPILKEAGHKLSRE